MLSHRESRRRLQSLGVDARIALTAPSGLGVDETAGVCHWFAQLTTLFNIKFSVTQLPLFMTGHHLACF